MPTDAKGIDALSERQKEVLRLTAKHLQAKEIARELDITERTVRAHTEAARKKLGAGTSREAVRIFMAQDIGSPIVKNDQWSSKPVGETVSVASLSAYEQALSSTTTALRNHDDQLPPFGNSMADVGSSRQTSSYRGRDRQFDVAEPDTRTGESNLQSGGLQRVHHGRWDEFRGRLKALSALQWLAIMIGIAVFMPVILALLVQAAANAIDVFQSLHAAVR